VVIGAYFINGYSLGGYWWLLVVIFRLNYHRLLMVINGYSIDGYWWLLMVITSYFINGYWCLFY
jgi:hypothetical protein